MNTSSQYGAATGGRKVPGKGHRFSAKQDRQATHIAASERARGMSAKEAKSVAYATVQKAKKKAGRKR